MEDLKTRLLNLPLPPKKDPMHELFGEVISSYSRAQAIEDGILVDVTETAKEAGIKYPVALTRAVFERCVWLCRSATGVSRTSVAGSGTCSPCSGSRPA